MTAEAQLLAEILADPAAEAPRRVYADLLLARGDPRGELIQVQCDAAALPEEDPARRALEDRAEELIAAHGEAWWGELASMRPEPRRGFVEAITLYSPQPVTRLGEVRRIAPLREVTLMTDDRTDGEIDPAFDPAGLEAVTIWPSAPVDDGARIDALARLDLGALRSLRLFAVGADALRVVAALPAPRLARLRISMVATRASPPDDVVDGFVRSRGAALEELTAWPTPGGAERRLLVPGLRSLFLIRRETGALPEEYGTAIAGLERLEELTLHRLECEPALPFLREDAALTSLALGHATGGDPAAALRPRRLKRLRLTGRQLTDEACVTLARAGSDSLEALGLPQNPIGDAAVRALAGSVRLERLRELDLTSTRVGAAGLEALADSALGSRLRSLTIDSKDAAVDAMLRVGSLGALEWLSLRAVTPVLLDRGLPSLRDLALISFDDDAARRLASSPGFSSLRRLSVDSARLGDEGARALAGSPHLGRLVTLRLGGGRLGDSAQAALRERFGGGLRLS